MPDSNNQGLHEEMERLESRLSEDIREIRMKLNDNGEAIVKLETLYGTLVKLPDTIDSLKETVVGINTNLQALNNRIETMQNSLTGQKETIQAIQSDNRDQSAQIGVLSNKGKFDLVDYVTKNLPQIFVVLAVLYLLIKDKLPF